MNYAYHKSVSICDDCVPFLSHTELTELTDIISLDVNIFCAFRAFCVPFLSHTEITELTDIISLDVNFLCFPCFLCAFIRTH